MSSNLVAVRRGPRCSGARTVGTFVPDQDAASESGWRSTSRVRVVRAMFVHEVMTREPTTVSADTTIKRTAEILTRRQISALPVLDVHRRICGVVSEADLIRHAFAPDPRAHLRRGVPATRSRAQFVCEVM